MIKATSIHYRDQKPSGVEPVHLKLVVVGSSSIVHGTKSKMYPSSDVVVQDLVVPESKSRYRIYI